MLEAVTWLLSKRLNDNIIMKNRLTCDYRFVIELCYAAVFLSKANIGSIDKVI